MLGWSSSSLATACDKELVMMKKPGFVENDNITLLAKGVVLRGETSSHLIQQPLQDGNDAE